MQKMCCETHRGGSDHRFPAVAAPGRSFCASSRSPMWCERDRLCPLRVKEEEVRLQYHMDTKQSPKTSEAVTLLSSLWSPCHPLSPVHTPHAGHGLFHPRFAVVVGHHGRARQEVHGSIWTTEARHTLFFAGPVAPPPPASAAHTTQAGRPLTLPPRLRRLPRSIAVAGNRGKQASHERCLDGTEEKARSSCPGWYHSLLLIYIQDCASPRAASTLRLESTPGQAGRSSAGDRHRLAHKE